MAKSPQSGDEDKPAKPVPRPRPTRREAPFDLPIFADKEPTLAERELVWAAKAGNTAFASGYPDADKEVRPALLRWLCQNSSDRNLVDPHGIRLFGATIPGKLDLNYLDIAVPLWLRDCEIGRLLLRARTREVGFSGSRFLAGVDAKGAQVDGSWFMDYARVAGTFAINSAVLEGQFNADGAAFAVEEGDAINAQAVKASAWFMDGAHVTGTFNIGGAVLQEVFSAFGATFAVEEGNAINAQAVKAMAWLMRSDSGGKCTKIHGLFDLNHAAIEQVELANAVLLSSEGVALRLDRARIGAFTTKAGFSASGAILAVHADIGRLKLERATLAAHWLATDATKPHELYGEFADCALSAVGAKIGRLDLPRGEAAAQKSATKPRVRGIIDLSRAKIGTLVDFADGWFAPLTRGEDCCEDRLTVAPNAHNGFKQARDIQHIVLDGTEYEFLEHPDGIPGAQRRVNGTIWQRFRHFLTIDHPKFDPPPRQETRRERWWTAVLTWVTSEHPHETPKPVPAPYSPGPKAEPVWKARSRWLMSQSAEELTHRFNPQPWRQLAQTLAHMGYEEDARHIAIRRRIAQRAAEPNLFLRAVSYLLHILANYGFSPWRTVLWSVGLIAVFGLAYGGLGQCWGECPVAFGSGTTARQIIAGDFIGVAGDVLAVAKDVGGNGTGRYPAFNPWFYSLDLFIPVLDLGSDTYWRPISLLGYALTVIEQILGAFLVALAVTGFTGLLTRDDRL
ncbi:MAG: hypothetical protein KKH72_07125 [Alphaproteobacteria bacterium]|nr:hypothetical protein [Alphaproteobacteria bacterium]